MVTLELLISSVVILMVLTFLYKENPVYRLAEYIAISISSAVLFVSAWRNIEKFGYNSVIGGNYVYILGIILGLLLYTRFIPRYDYLSRYGISVLVGVSFGLSVTGTIRSQILDQIIATAESPLTGVPIMTAFSNLILIIIVITGVVYFIYSLYGTRGTGRQSPIFDGMTRIGRYGLMLAFGTMLGNMVMDRFASAIDVLRTLLALFGLGQI
jgi:hypothetical protein